MRSAVKSFFPGIKSAPTTRKIDPNLKGASGSSWPRSSSSNSDYPSPEAAKAQIEEIAALLRQGESFGPLAKKFSKDPSAAQGGDLGFFPLTEIDPSLAQALAPLKPGETTPVLSHPEGWRLVQLVKRETTQAAGLEEARERIQEMLYQEEVESRAGQWLLKLRERSSIQILL